jgi:hypothetical protein
VNEEKYKAVKKEIVGDESDHSGESGDESGGSDAESGSDEEEEEKSKLLVPLF